MVFLTIIAGTMIFFKVLAMGALMVQSGESSQPLSYSERWANVVLGLALWGTVLYIALAN